MSKIYGGNAKLMKTKFGEIWKVSQSRKDLEGLLQYLNDNDAEWVNLDIKEKPQIVEGKPTHYLQVWQKEAVQVANQNEGNFKKISSLPTEKRILENDNLPF
jgi:hypothetical protein